MNRLKAKDDKKALEKFLRLAVLGSALIIVIYSIYYYSNSYKNSRTNLYNIDIENDIELRTLQEFDAQAAYDINILYTNNQERAIFEGKGGWKHPSLKSEVPFINERTTVAMSGLIEAGFHEIFTSELKKKFHNSPPVRFEAAKGIEVRSIQFEQYVFPYHAMINWRDTGAYKTFSVYADSLKGEVVMATNGFKWSNGLNGEYIKVIQKVGRGALNELMILEGDKQPELIKMPILDFDVVFSNSEHLGLEFLNKADKSVVSESKGELKMLVGPSLKQNNVYDINEDGYRVLEIKPPFYLELGKVEGDIPYFFALIANEKLLLK